MQERLADVAAVSSVSVMGITWLAEVGLILQILASIGAIIAVFFSVRYHIRNTPPKK